MTNYIFVALGYNGNTSVFYYFVESRITQILISKS